MDLFAKEINQKPNFTILSNWLLKSIGVFVSMMGELAEMNYQCDRDYIFDSSKFNKFFDYTPVSSKMAVRQVVKTNQTKK